MSEVEELRGRLAEAERVLRKIVHDWDGEPDDIGDAQRWLTGSASVPLCTHGLYPWNCRECTPVTVTGGE